jgi:DNA polymerase-3 subunit gamma/tau
VSTGPSLYRRHRPRTFADVVGQEHVVRTLQNAVEQGKVHHAYLFVGSRGTGKTSMAKILAACLNCDGVSDPPTPDRPTTSPCGKCDSCVAIANATSLDVIEMDAASNNSVDDIRDLREKVGYAPVSGRHKVYILDEAHMLSPQAWNAFLKTLEEPPPRTIFVLATTEAQKVLPTVVDRCHRFDFGRPTVEQVTTVLQRVSEKEAIDVDRGALALIARHATGSFRDALGTLEQLLTYAGGRAIEPADVLAVLGVADAEQLFEAVDAIIARDPARALRAAASLADSGRDSGQLLRDLEVHGRELLAVQVLGDVPPEFQVTPERDIRLAEQATALSATDAVRLLDLVSAALEATANGAQARIQLELVLIKAAAPAVDPSMAALLARIERLEGDPTRALRSTDSVSGGAGLRAVQMPDPEAAPPAASREPAAGPQPNGDPARPPAELSAVRDLWPAVVDQIKEGNAMLAHALAVARPVDVSEDELVVAFPVGSEFNKRKAEQDEHRRMVADVVKVLSGRKLVPRYELRELEAAPPETLSDDKLVQRFVEEFDAEEILDDPDPDERS